MPGPTSGLLFKWRLVIIVAASFFFGVMMSIIKGNDIGIRDAIGNVCASWLLLPFLSSVFAKRHRTIQAAIVGLLASFCAFTGFYFTNSFVLDLGPHPWVVDISLTMRSGWFYFVLSFLSGPFFGFLGGWYIRYKTSGPALLMALLFVLEPCVWTLYEAISNTASVAGFSSFLYYPIVSVVEATIGVIACIVLVIHYKLFRR